jgi:cell wall-associated NlpC family hydrolase
MALANRRTSIEPADLREILRDDSYKRIARDEADPGDLVVYAGSSGEPTHVAIITHRPVTAPDAIYVMSAWGSDGEYTHVVDDVPAILGMATEFWTDRK